MNGNLPVQKRVELYKLKRIIFATPQTFENDLLANRIDAKEIVLIIFGECLYMQMNAITR